MSTPARRIACRACALVAALAIGGILVGPAANGVAAAAPGTASTVTPSVGFYPVRVTFARALRTGQFLETVGMMNNSPKPRAFRFGLVGPAAGWLSVVEPSDQSKVITSLVVPPGGRVATALLRLEVPRHAADGAYHAVLDVVAMPEAGATAASGGGEDGVAVGGQVPVSIFVTGTEVIAGALRDASTDPAIEVGEPLRLYLTVQNSGNVAMDPMALVVITRPGAIVYRHVFYNQLVGPGQIANLEDDWPGAATDVQPLGRYNVHVTVSFRSHILGSRALPVELVAYGTLRRGGKLLELALTNRPQLGYVAVAGALVENTGQIQAETIFTGQLFLNNHLVGAENSVPLLVQPDHTAIIRMVIPVSKHGTYRLTGVANFAGANSSARTLVFQVAIGTFPTSRVAALGAGVLAGLLGLLWFRRRRGRGRDHRPDGNSPGGTKEAPRHVKPVQPPLEPARTRAATIVRFRT